MKIKKRLGKEYQNTYLIEFRNQTNIPRLLAILERLHMITVRDVKQLWEMKELSESDPNFCSLCEMMNHIAPEGCRFQVKISNRKVIGSEHTDRYIKVGFFAA